MSAPKTLPISRALLFAGLLTSITGIASAQNTNNPVLLDNCGESLNLSSSPERVVTVGQATTEMLYSLGLHSKVVGTSGWFTDVDEAYRDVDSKIERIADTFPSFESVVSKKPDLVTADFLFSIGPQGVVGKREQFHSLGVNTYVLASQCIDQDSSRGVDGVRSAMFSLENLYQSIRDISRIFAVEQRGEILINEIEEREKAAIHKAEKHKSEDLSAVFWYSSVAMGVDPWVAGSKGVPGWMMSTLGIKNVVDSDEVWPMVGWEAIAKANPDIIVIAKMSRRRFEGDDFERKLEYLRTDPVTREMKAVLNNRIIVMDAHAMEVTLRSIDGLEELINAVDKLDSVENTGK